MSIISNLNNKALQLLPDIAVWKQQIADAINKRGGNANPNSAFTQLAQDIEDIENFPIAGVEYISEIYRPRTLMEAYNNRIYIKRITDDFTEEVKDYAFINCKNLEFVNLLNVVEIKGFAFNGCENLMEVNFPNLVTITGSHTFSTCRKLDSLNFPNLLSLTGHDTFANCSSLKLANFPNLRTITNRNTFNSCPLENLVLGVLVSFADFYDTKKRLRNITIGQSTNINLPFQNWTAQSVIAEGQSGIDELNSNLYNNLLTKLYDHSSDGETRILRIGWLDYITPENIAYANAKGWTITN